MEYKINELIFEILSMKTCDEKDTEIFKKLKHNNDLAPKYKENFQQLAQSIDSYYNDCYDIQGVKDDGVDVLLKYRFEGAEHKIGFQIKSYDDLKDKNWLKNLKAQLFEAQGIWKTEDLYVVLCTDAIEHKDKLRNAIAEIEKSSNCKIHIVQPENALTFYNYNSMDIFLNIYDFFHENDSSLQKARQCVQSLNKKELKFLIHVIVKQFINHEKGISLDDTGIPEIDFTTSSFYNYDDYNYSISYSYENHWELTNFVVEIRTHSNLNDCELEDFLMKELGDEDNDDLFA